jgi:hypothetical protein
MTDRPQETVDTTAEHRPPGEPDPWSTPLSEEDADVAEEPDAERSEDPSLANTTTPPSGLADPNPRAGHGDPPTARPPKNAPPDDERAHEADFATTDHDDRQEDAMPGAARETPEEFVERKDERR